MQEISLFVSCLPIYQAWRAFYTAKSRQNRASSNNKSEIRNLEYGLWNYDGHCSAGTSTSREFTLKTI